MSKKKIYLEQENFDILTLLKQNQNQMAKAEGNDDREKTNKRRSGNRGSGDSKNEESAPKKMTKLEKKKIEKMER